LRIAALDRIGTVVSLRRDQALFHEGDPARDFFKVVTGAVRSYRLLTDGRRQISAFALPGDFVALEPSPRDAWPTCWIVTDSPRDLC
jgi:CRP/FNR family transcriptional regulator, nitrogen fixation regulation protein